MSDRPIELGHEHFARFVGWHPDRALNPHYADILDIERCALVVEHPSKRAGDVNPCVAVIHFDTPDVARVFPKQRRWTVESWDPLTLSPSILCTCGDHGFIRNGRWEPA